MACRHELPCGTQRCDIDPSAQAIPPLLESRIRGRVCVAHEELLQWRERVDVLHVTRGTDQPIQGRLIQPGERKIRRGVPAGAWSSAMGNHAAQCAHVRCRHLPDHLVVMRRSAVTPAHLQLAVQYEGIHLEQMRTPRVRRVPGPRVLARKAHHRGTRHHLVELSEVVEHQIGRSLRAQRFHTIQVSQHAVAQAASRCGAQQLLCLLDARADIRCGQAQSHWKDRGEPAQRARHIRRRHHVFTAMPFDIHHEVASAQPRAHALAERGEQDVVDLCGVRRRHGLEELARLHRIEAECDGRRIPREPGVRPRHIARYAH